MTHACTTDTWSLTATGVARHVDDNAAEVVATRIGRQAGLRAVAADLGHGFADVYHDRYRRRFSRLDRQLEGLSTAVADGLAVVRILMPTATSRFSRTPGAAP
jgi:hypothetical protein